MRHVLAFVPFVLLALGCGGHLSNERTMARGDRAYSSGRFEEAARAYAAAANEADKARHQDRALYLSAMAFVRAGNRGEARSILVRLAKEEPAGEYTAIGAYKLAGMIVESEGIDAGIRALDEVYTRHPSAGISKRAFHVSRALREERDGQEKVLLWLRNIDGGPLHKTDIGEPVAYDIASLLERMDRKDAAVLAYVSVATEWPYPRGAHYDDALVKASDLELGRGNAVRAAQLLEELMHVQETSEMMGSYQRPRVIEAAFKLAEIYRDHVKDNARAISTYRFIYRRVSTAKRDKALWEIAAIERFAGDPSSACRTMRTLVDEFPNSRYVPCAEEACPGSPGIKRSEKSKAPATCRDYLKRARTADASKASE